MSSNYEKITILGRGVFGAAFLMQRKSDQEQFVMKQIVVTDMTDEEIKTAKNEAAVLASLNHMNIVGYVESFVDQDQGVLNIVMEYADGGTLAQQISKKDPFPEEQILDWFIQLASALEHIHTKNILHRDLKTQNVFLDRDKFVKLGDFGLAKVLSNHTVFGKTAVGTPYYLSPELVEGKTYDQKSDMWALGCILYEMLTLRHAFEGSSLPELVQKIVDCVPDPMGDLYSSTLCAIVPMLLQRDPTKRPTAHEILRLPLVAARFPAIEQAMRRAKAQKKARALAAPSENSKTTAHTLLRLSEDIVLKILSHLDTRSVCQVAQVDRAMRRLANDVGLWRGLVEKKFGQMDSDVPSWRNLYIELETSDVWTWGAGQNPRRVDYLLYKGVRSIAFGYSHKAAVLYTGDVYTFGNGDHGQLGHGDRGDRKLPAPVKALKSIRIVMVACGQYHTLALTASGEVYGWGENDDGQLGVDVDSDSTTVPTPTLVRGALAAKNVSFIACGAWHSTALTQEGEVYTWGNTGEGRLGVGETEENFERLPRRIEKLVGHKIVHIGLGETHSGAVTDDGKLYMWGGNDHGKLGTGNDVSRTEPVRVKSLEGQKVIQVACGTDHTLALLDTGGVYSWGDDEYGQLGHGSSEKKPARSPKGAPPFSPKNQAPRSPTQNRLGPPSPSPGAGPRFAVSNSDMNLGDGLRARPSSVEKNDHTIPRLIKFLLGKGVAQIACGNFHSAAVTEFGEVYTWGQNDVGQLGSNDRSDQKAPKKVNDISGNKMCQIACGFSSCGALVGRNLPFRMEKNNMGTFFYK